MTRTATLQDAAAPGNTPPPAPAPVRVARRRKSRADFFLGLLARAGAISVLLMLATLIVVLTIAALPSIRTFGVEFLTTTEWRPNELEQPARGPDGSVLIEDGETVMETIPPKFGALPVIYGTVVSSIIALCFAVPLSLGAALFIVRVAPRLRIAAPLSFLIEFLAAIPSIAYGIWGLFVFAPFLRNNIEPAIQTVLGKVPGFHWMFSQQVKLGATVIDRPIPLTGRDMFAGGLVLGIMVLPIITAVSRDVLRSVPRMQIEGTQALGATWWQSSWGMLRYARAGLFGAVMLGLARAAGETMAITMVIGNNNQIVASPFAPAQTMSSLLANEFAEASGDLHRAALLEVALILLFMSLAINVIARYLVVGRRRGGAH
jgi:phosphate transport system permease protein